MKRLRYLLLVLLITTTTQVVFARHKAPKDAVKMTGDYKKLSGDDYELVFHVTLKKGYYLKANNDMDSMQKLKLPNFTFNQTDLFRLQDSIASKGLIETKKLKRIGIVNLYSYSVLYSQRVTAAPGAHVTGNFHFQVCNDRSVYRAGADKFDIHLK